MDEFNGYHYSCDPGYSQDTSGNRTVIIDDCLSNPCGNGLCQDAINGFTCNCYPGSTGTTCDMDMNDCNLLPCDFFGFNSFVDGNQTCICNCRAGYTGKLCEMNINNCNPNPCQNNGTCLDGIAILTHVCVILAAEAWKQ